MRLTMPVEAAAGEHPLDLVGEQEQRRDRRGVVGLVLDRVVERGRQRQELRDPAGGPDRRPVGVDLGDPLERRRARDREPEATVGGEALLRGEVVDVGVADVHRQTAGARGRVDQHERIVVEPGRPDDRHHHAGRGLVVRPGDHVGAVLGGRRGIRGVAGRRLDDDRVGKERRVLGAGRDLRGELAVAQVQCALADDAGDRRVPEGGGAAVAEQDLVAVGQARTAHAARRARGRPAA